MATEVKMPRLSLTMESGVLLRWLKAVGDFVTKGEGLAEIETDKATAILEAPASGFVRALLVDEGSEAACDAVLSVLTPSLDEIYEGAGEAPASKPTEVASTGTLLQMPLSAGIGAQIQASPAAKHLAKQLGIDLTMVTGTGPRGRIGLEDVQRAADERDEFPEVKADASPAALAGRRVPLTRMRAAIARRMVESAMTIPQFSVRRRVDMSEALKFLDTSNQSVSAQKGAHAQWAPKPSAGYPGAGLRPTEGTPLQKQTSGVADILHFVVARALRAHPEVNASFEPGTTLESSQIVEHEAVNLGIAVALPDGLVVPVIRGADKMSLQSLTEVRIQLQDEAQRGRLPVGSLGEATFTVSNLGTLGADDFLAMVNPPEAAILAVGRVQDAVVVRDGSFRVAPVVVLSITADHRVLDGAQVARFLQTLSEYLNNLEAVAI